MSRPRWDRLVATLAEADIAANVDESSYPGGISYGITITHNNTLIMVRDQWWRKNAAVWIGWSVWTEGRRDSIVRREWPPTKKRSEVTAAIQAALDHDLDL